jgi:maltose alpha-D-glucosyltransferase/alpha-amylase
VQPAEAVLRHRRRDLIARFRDIANKAFLSAYHEVSRNTKHRWIDESQEAALIDLALIEKAAYEVSYEVAHRPDWVSIPLTGLVTLADRLLSCDTTSGPVITE